MAVVLHVAAVAAALAYLLAAGMAATGMTEMGAAQRRRGVEVAGAAVALTAFVSMGLVLRHALGGDGSLLAGTALAPLAAGVALIVGGPSIYGNDRPSPIGRLLRAVLMVMAAALPGALSLAAASA